MTLLNHENSVGNTVDWLTPPWLLKKFPLADLDPCAAPRPRPWPTAKEMWTSEGLDRPWYGSVWLNPPYGRGIADWLEKMADHGRGLAFIFTRTETRYFHDQVFDRATSLCFLRGRVKFHYPDGKLSQGTVHGSVLIAYGKRSAYQLARANLAGRLITL